MKDINNTPESNSYNVLQQVQQIQIDRKQDILLRFKPEFESKFVQHHIGKGWRVFISEIISILLWLAFLVSDFQARTKTIQIILRSVGAVLFALLCIPLGFSKVIRKTTLTEILILLYITIYNSFMILKDAIRVRDNYSPIGSALVLTLTVMIIRLRLQYILIMDLILVIVLISSFFGFNTDYIFSNWQVASRATNNFFYLLIALLAVNIQYYFLEKYLRNIFMDELILNALKEQTEMEKERSRILLENILPKHLIPKIKKGSTTFFEKHTNCTILLSDLVDFTKFCSTISAEEVVGALNTIFSYFDALLPNYQLEKIKTIGDAYFCVGGLTKQSNPEESCVDMAIEMIKGTNHLNKHYGWNFKIRIGIAAGEVIAGVIGSSKITFDCWGQAVQLAEDLESLSFPNCIHISYDVMKATEQKFNFIPRGFVNTFSQGLCKTFFVVGRVGEEPILTDKELISIANENNPSFNGPPEYRRKTSTMTLLNSPYKEETTKSTETIKPLNETVNLKEIRESDYRINVFTQMFNSFKLEMEYINESYKALHLNIGVLPIVSCIVDIYFIVGIATLYTSKIISATSIALFVSIGMHLIIIFLFTIPRLNRSTAFGWASTLTSVILHLIIPFCTLADYELQDYFMNPMIFIGIVLINLAPNLPLLFKILVGLGMASGHCVGEIIMTRTLSFGTIMEVSCNVLIALMPSIFSSLPINQATRKSFTAGILSRKEIEETKKEQKRNDDLILSAIPKAIAEQLKYTQSETLCNLIKSGGACFVNIVGFDDAVKENPSKALYLLGELFTCYDMAAEKYNCQKVKSIGSRYLCVSACVDNHLDNAERITLLALELLEISNNVLGKRKDQIPSTIKGVQIGVHCGDFVAGVLGKIKFLYDVFGDTVNVASRMCTTGSLNKIQCCSSMKERIEANFDIEERGIISVKGKGNIATFYIVGKKYEQDKGLKIIL